MFKIAERKVKGETMNATRGALPEVNPIEITSLTRITENSALPLHYICFSSGQEVLG